MIFKSTYVKLTAFYLAIVMIISISFSVGMYKISSSELNRGLNRQSNAMMDFEINGFSNNNVPFLQNLTNSRDQQLRESSARLRNNLIYFNLFIFVVFSIASYFFSRWTMKPIEENLKVQKGFTADASHELRTPLAAIKSEIEVGLRDKKFKFDDAKKLLVSNLEEINKLENLSNSLLKLSRYDEDNSKYFERFSLEDAVVEAYEKVENLAAKKSIVFENKLENIKAYGDKKSITEAIIIFLDNAIKYSPKNSKIKIKIFKDNKNAHVEIKDNGAGIKQTDLKHIFDRFYRADQSRNKEKTDGFGLGLSIAKKIIDFHKGDILVDSKIGKGTKFIVTLPLKPSAVFKI